MKLAKILAPDFSARVRERGQEYYSLGRVRIERGTATRVEGTVTGSQDYAVRLDWRNQVLFARCECPFYADINLCKHVWAVILAADVYGYLSVAAAVPDLLINVEYDDKAMEASAGSWGQPARTLPPVAVAPPKPPAWQEKLAALAAPAVFAGGTRLNWPAARQILYVVEVESSHTSNGLVIAPLVLDVRPDGNRKVPVRLSLRRAQIAQLPCPEDREILTFMAGIIPNYNWGYMGDTDRISESYVLSHPTAEKVVSLAARVGRCRLQTATRFDELNLISWDDGELWRAGIELRRHSKGGWAVDGLFRRGEERLRSKEVYLASPTGLLFTRDRAARLALDTPFHCLSQFQQIGSIRVPESDLDKLLASVLTLPGLPEIEMPAEVRIDEISLTPQIFFRISTTAGARSANEKLSADLSFQYDGRMISAHDRSRGFLRTDPHRFVRRDSESEGAAKQLLRDLGAKQADPSYWEPEPPWKVSPSRLPRVVRGLVEAGWHVEAEGKTFRRPGAFKLEVSTGIDWFELHGGVDYGEASATLPELLEALRRGENIVRLGDGSYGILPEEWLKKIGLFARLGTPEESHVRFRHSQVGLLDALLISQESDTQCDETFARLRQELAGFKGLQAAPQPTGFVGHLRGYQREGLSWMQFLRSFSFGGCLADDMGVGKTAQVLAMLETRRAERTLRNPVPPSLVVVPRSLVFNWIEEAARFTPRLRVLDCTTSSRGTASFAGYDIILATYGTLRRDVLRLKDVEFEYVILDEAQAIKNASTEAAKAARLLCARHRLALSGTPVENHLGELWSLFEFLNPGMLGRASVFKLHSGAVRDPDEGARRLLAHALRPFILRRTKAQVAPELPPKTEQTLYCELETTQRRLYNELREHYRDRLLKRIEEEGLAKSKIQVLEALLRLRQAACHPGLIDHHRASEGSAKLDTLLEQLREILDEGHKALVFSQFTSLLAIVRARLDTEGVTYEYLDGATTDRQARVERFQNDTNCRLFLVSLKAGGLGLNLTAAEYVFLLDPWWNPAVEAQAIDRAHRIGQTQQVFAYRLIARDTVEEKVLELQKSKRDLAAAIISEDNSLIRDLRREDLELLLS